MNELICIYILTHNRPELVKRTLMSVVRQSYKNIKIIISDNSDNDETRIILQDIVDYDQRIEYVKREQGLSNSIKHFNFILKNNKYEYFIMFHDDDEMKQDMIKTLYETFKRYENACAVACNAYFNKNGKYTTERLFSATIEEELKTTLDIVRKYNYGGIAPFPSYMYRVSKIKGLELDYRYGGKYSDTSFIISLVNHGSVIYSPKCEMYYYISNFQDSYFHEYSQYLSLINYLTRIVPDKSEIRNMRIFNIYNQLCTLQREGKKIPFKKDVYYLLFKYSLKNYFLKYNMRLLKLYTK